MLPLDWIQGNTDLLIKLPILKFWHNNKIPHRLNILLRMPIVKKLLAKNTLRAIFLGSLTFIIFLIKRLPYRMLRIVLYLLLGTINFVSGILLALK